jgi:HK97 family phage portal protein
LKLIKSIRTRGVKGSIQDYIRRFLAGDDVSDQEEQYYSTGNMDTQTAMKYTAVFACIRVLSETFASCPVMLYRKNKDGTRESANDLPIYSVLHDKPNDEMAPFNFKETMMMNANSGGNMYAERLFNKFGDVVGLYPYRWEMVRMDRDENKQLIYRVRDGTGEVTKTRKEIFHVPGMSFDGVCGLSPIQYAAGAIGLGMAYEMFSNGFYRNGTQASGAFSSPTELSDTAYDRLKKDITEKYTGLRNSGRPILLEGGLTFVPFTINPADAQLIENKKFQIEDIARIYRVPLHLIQNLDKATNNNIEHQSLEFIMYTMLPWFKRFEENSNMQLLSDKERLAGYYVECKIDSLLRGDAASRATAYAQGRQWGYLSANDIRRLENMSPIPNGDIYLQPVNMVSAGTSTDTKTQQLVESIYKMITDHENSTQKI